MEIKYSYDYYYINKLKSNDFNIINYNMITFIECYNCDLIEFPILSINLKVLNCSHNYLINLSILPNSLINLYCNNNYLIYLPKISNNLIVFYCHINKLNNLPILP